MRARSEKLTSAELSDRLARFRRPLLVSHTRPDGDAVGSLVALDGILRQRGADPVPLLYEPLPDRYAYFERFERIHILPPGVTAGVAVGDAIRQLAGGGPDGIVLLDTCAKAQIQPVADWLVSSGLESLAIDHHATRDELVDAVFVDERAAATCLILHEWVRFAGTPLTRAIAEPLFLGLAMDTGWFRHANTDARALRAAAELAECGVEPHNMFRWMYQRDSAARVRLLGVAVESMELAAGMQLAIMTLPASVVFGLGAAAADTEDIVNEPLRVASVVVSVLLVEQEEGRIRASLRSKPPVTSDDLDVDVAAIAGAFGGGGHRRAAGVRFDGTLTAAKSVLRGAVEQALRSTK